MTLLYAIDPGARAKTNRASYGAIFDANELLAVTSIQYPPSDSTNEYWLESPEVLVIEKPQQDGRSSRVPPKVLIDLAWHGALIAGAMRARHLVAYTPDQWKGQVSKPVHHLRIWRALKPIERACFPPDTEERIRKGAEATARAGKLTNYSFEAHNLLDACGLGLFHLKRIGKGGARR